ncbi:MAG: cupin domain-containing protein [Gaiellales bacterium]
MTSQIDVAATERFAGYEALCPWHHRQPFADGVQEPRLITRKDALYCSGLPERQEPVWMYVSTHRVNAGTLFVQPGEGFEPGDHPGPEPYYCLRGELELGNPDTGSSIRIKAGDAANIPALAQHWARNVGEEPAEVIWWVPGEMHTDEWKEKIHKGVGKWYEREPVTFDGPRDRNEGFTSHLDDLGSWPPARPARLPYDMHHLPRSTWLHMLHGTDRRRTILVSFFYCDERIRIAKLQIPHSGETEPRSGDYERLLYVESGTLSVTLVGTGQGIVAEPGDMVFLPPHTEHCLQAIDVGPVTALSAWALAA